MNNQLLFSLNNVYCILFNYIYRKSITYADALRIDIYVKFFYETLTRNKVNNVIYLNIFR